MWAGRSAAGAPIAIRAAWCPPNPDQIIRIDGREPCLCPMPGPASPCLPPSAPRTAALIGPDAAGTGACRGCRARARCCPACWRVPCSCRPPPPWAGPPADRPPASRRSCGSTSPPTRPPRTLPSGRTAASMPAWPTPARSAASRPTGPRPVWRCPPGAGSSWAWPSTGAPRPWMSPCARRGPRRRGSGRSRSPGSGAHACRDGWPPCRWPPSPTASASTRAVPSTSPTRRSGASGVSCRARAAPRSGAPIRSCAPTARPSAASPSRVRTGCIPGMAPCTSRTPRGARSCASRSGLTAAPAGPLSASPGCGPWTTSPSTRAAPCMWRPTPRTSCSGWRPTAAGWCVATRARDGLDNPSAVAFGVGAHRTDLYIANAAYFSPAPRPSVQRLHVGTPGAPTY